MNQQEIEELRQIIGTTNNDTGTVIQDPCDDPPDRPNARYSFTKQQSFGIVQLSIEKGNKGTAEYLGLSTRTVERHRAYWLGGSQKHIPKFTECKRVDDRLCGAMRCMADDGYPLSVIAEKYGIGISTVHNHVSMNANQPCDHRVPVEVPRVGFLPGHVQRERDENGRFA